MRGSWWKRWWQRRRQQIQGLPREAWDIDNLMVSRA